MTIKTGGYQLNEKDIDSMIRFLKATDPELATPEMAIDILEHLKAGVHTMADLDPEKLKEIFEEIKKQKILRNN